MSTVFATPANDASSTLTAAYSVGANQLTVANGTVFPNVSGGNFFVVTVIQAAQAYNPQATTSNYTIYKATAVSGNVITIDSTHPLDGTSDQAYSVGDVVEVRWTAGQISAIYTAVNAGGGGGGVTIGNSVSGGTAHGVLFADASVNLADNGPTWDGTYFVLPGGTHTGFGVVNGLFASVYSAGNFFTDSAVGDVIFRVTGYELRLGYYPTVGSSPSQLQFTSSTVNVNPQTSSGVALTVSGLASQTGDLQHWNNSSGANLSGVRADGSFSLPYLANSSASNNSLFWDTTNSKLCYKDPAGTLHEV